MITANIIIMIPYLFELELSVRVYRYIPKMIPNNGIKMAQIKPKTVANVWLFSTTGGW